MIRFAERDGSRSGIVAIVLMLALSGSAVAEEELGWFDWIAVAPEVAVVDVREQEGKFIRAQVVDVIRGDLEPGEFILLDQRSANRERNASQRMVRLHTRPGLYVALLESVPREDERPIHRLVRGVESTRELPKEGSAAVLDALREFAVLQDERDFTLAWIRLAELIENSNNPVILEGALDQYVKFRRGDVGLLGSLEPLLEHPRAGIRERAAAVIGIIAERAWDEDPEPLSEVQPVVIARARRDDVVAVRVAATRALGQMPGESTRTVLDEISRDDPEQSVRYEAERILYDWRETDPAGGRAGD